MTEAGEDLARKSEPYELGVEFMASQRKRLEIRKKFTASDYERLLEPWVGDRSVLVLSEALDPDAEPRDRITCIRHDIDHDIEMAVSIGRWEAERGLRTTFCVLHSAWYYGSLFDGRYYHTTEMLDAVKELQFLGHEINFHNNIATEALLNGVDPEAVLMAELEYLRSHGLHITGTSGHGHALCGQLDYLNLELFRETTWLSKGGARTIAHNGNSIELGRTSMADFGLAYEAYDLHRDVYITESGGRPRLVKNTRGRNGLRRDEATDATRHGHVVGILTHPIYWDVHRNADHVFPDFGALEDDYSARQALRQEERRVRQEARRTLRVAERTGGTNLIDESPKEIG